ncbi:deoxynucleotidyltransferase terminal-interacting protein 2 [Ceratina calcarata]|uniref:Deoxynucleotidyltransferase terminal-interacting protein 2 n=1 Tax=Ceratina calcarata TaxID=156304 RepID=A0AAJ7IZX9_9HYME|nr:deoxynucleotidyltransferase terminal-interacting protein 2 [Ceratina calcarata]
MDIIIDTKGQTDLATRNQLIESDEDDIDFENTEKRSSKFFDIEENLIENEIGTRKVRRNVTKDIDLEEFERDMGWTRKNKRRKPVTAPKITNFKQELTAVDKILKKSIITPGFEQLEVVPPYDLSKRQLQYMRRKERSKTKGKDWFNMSAPELTPEVKHDLQVLRMRSVLDPKHFYKKNDLKALPKYFQIGKVMDSPLDYYSGRLTKKERKKTIVDELMADAQFAKYNKRKYKEIIEEKQKTHYKAHRHAKKLKGKKGKKK